MAANAHRGTAEWGVTIVGKSETPEHDKIVVTRYDPPRLTLEVSVPSIRSAAEQQGTRGYQALQDAVDSLQQVLKSKNLPGLS
jgi:hypothetical protein